MELGHASYIMYFLKHTAWERGPPAEPDGMGHVTTDSFNVCLPASDDFRSCWLPYTARTSQMKLVILVHALFLQCNMTEQQSAVT